MIDIILRPNQYKISQNAEVKVTATVLNDSTNSGVNWSLKPVGATDPTLPNYAGGAAAGSLTNITPFSVVFVPLPYSIGLPVISRLTATSVANPNVSRSMLINS